MASAETKFDLDKILRQLGGAFLTASRDLRKEFDKKDWADVPYIYHLPKMRVSMQVALSYSDGKVHGNFITGKRTKTEEAELVTTIDIDLVSVPREVEAPTTASGTTTDADQDSGEPSGEPSDGDTTPASDEEGPDEAAPAPRPMPATVRLRPAAMANEVRRALKDLHFTDIGKARPKGGGIFEVEAKWQGERKKLRVDTRVGTIQETGA